MIISPVLMLRLVIWSCWLILFISIFLLTRLAGLFIRGFFSVRFKSVRYDISIILFFVSNLLKLSI